MKNSNTTSDVILQCSVSFEHDEFTSHCLLHVKVMVKFSLSLINLALHYEDTWDIAVHILNIGIRWR
jgi:hypothetical protein